MLELRLSIEGEHQSVVADFYDYADELKKWGAGLMTFPTGVNEEIAFEKGAKDGNAYLWLAVRAFVADGVGNTAVEIEYKNRATACTSKSCALRSRWRPRRSIAWAPH